MTTERQRAANRRNAARSTGPKSAAGQARASRNARRHGLTARPNPGEIDKWMCIIIGSDRDVDLPDPQDPEWPALFRLAEAEAHLQRVREYQTQLLVEDQTGSLKLNQVLGDMSARACLRLWEHRERRHLSRKEVRDARQTVDMYFRHFRKTTREARDIRRRVKRYRAQAEVRRGKALRAWIEVKKRNEPNCNPEV